MNKSRKLIDKILSGEKTIESRRYKSKKAPWNGIQSGDTIFFKNSGEEVIAKATIKSVIQYENTNGEYTNIILQKYGGKGGIYFSTSESETKKWVENKKYVILVFLENPQRIVPFNINKTGFGISCAWLSLKNIDKIKI